MSLFWHCSSLFGALWGWLGQRNKLFTLCICFVMNPHFPFGSVIFSDLPVLWSEYRVLISCHATAVTESDCCDGLWQTHTLDLADIWAKTTNFNQWLCTAQWESKRKMWLRIIWLLNNLQLAVDIPKKVLFSPRVPSFRPEWLQCHSTRRASSFRFTHQTTDFSSDNLSRPAERQSRNLAAAAPVFIQWKNNISPILLTQINKTWNKPLSERVGR